ncbi:MAG: DMT family transporter [Pirellulaceae bacterium]|nr:DMT family transporter [Pirellulaceae bacterium]
MSETEPKQAAIDVLPGEAALPVDPHATRPLDVPAAALALLTAALWGGTAVAVSFSVDWLPPLAVAAIRFTLGAAFLLVWCRWERSSLRLRSDQLVPALLAGLLLFLQIGTFNWGLWLSSSSHGTLLINTFVFWVVGLEHFVTRTDRLTRGRLLGLIVAAAGAALIFPATFSSGAAADGSTASGTAARLAADPPSLAGDLLLLSSAMILGVKIVYTKHALRVVEPGKLIFWHNVVGVAAFLASSLVLERIDWSGFQWPALWGLLYQGVIVAGLCFAIQAVLLKRHSASRIAVFSFCTPLFGVLAAVVFRGDPLSPWLMVSAVAVALGIWLVTRPVAPAD